jgi:predicted nucleic acid-binding protein
MYLDTSILVKLYTAEADSVECSKAVAGAPIASSALAYGEMCAALLAKERAGEISAPARAAAWATFLQDLESGVLTLFPLSASTVREATEVMQEVHPHLPLRTLDALHVGTFCTANAGPLFTKDKRMIAAARFLELELVR